MPFQRLITVLLTLLPALSSLAQEAGEDGGDGGPSILERLVGADPKEEAVELSPLVRRLLADDLLSDEQKRSAKIFHGQWDGLGDLTPREQLQLAVLQHRVDEETIDKIDRLIAEQGEAPSFEDLYLLAEADRLAGRAGKAIASLNFLDQKVLQPKHRLQYARIYEDLGRFDKAIHIATLPDVLLANPLQLSELPGYGTPVAELFLMLARLEGRPAADFHLANRMLAKVRDEVDPLYWPAHVAEAQLLMAKGNPREAIEAITQALSLNPRSSEAWYAFGSMQTRFFNFDAANKAVEQLREINDKHPLGKALSIQIALRQKDVPKALEVIESALDDYPTHRQLLALGAATHALNYDVEARDAALAKFAELAPGNPLGEFMVGRTMSDARQYAIAETHLKNAIAMMPGWSEPQLALGALYMQWGKLDEAATQLLTASSLDPFHKEITNQLTLAQEMLGYETIQTDQIVIRYLPGIDEVLARDVALHMGDMAEVFIQRFQHDPPALTQVDLMPDDPHFAVRVTGMPDVWTIAACTGDVIAMTPPRPGPKRAYGTYNWLNVMGHEYAHVVNLSQTDNRVPHWFTEGCAVRMETTGRLWQQYQLLAECYNTDKLFDYDELNWGFIRPTEQYHRPLAYAQSAWIKQYIEEEHGWDKALKMLSLYQAGKGEHEVILEVFGVEPDALMQTFCEWAGKQVQAWGMSTYGIEPVDETVIQLLSAEDVAAIDPAALDAAIAKHPDEPDLLRLKAGIALRGEDNVAATQAVKAYQAKRPVDPWSDRELAKLALKSGDSATAEAALLNLDKIEGDAPEYAVELARVYRARKDYPRALRFAERALLREPYNATYRETAATVAVLMKDLKRAAFHVASLELLEPDRAIHPKRLAVIYERLGQQKEANAARKRAAALE